jgi:hypothetical protein
VNANNQPASPSLAVLDINKYEWSTPDVNNPIGSVYLAPSVVINDLMFLYVGNYQKNGFCIDYYNILLEYNLIIKIFSFFSIGVNVTTGIDNAFNKVFMLDTSTYTWSGLDPVAVNSNDNIYSSGNNQITGGNADTINKNDLTVALIIILIVISSILVLTILGVTFYRLYRSKTRSQISPKVIDNSHQQHHGQV